MDDIQDQNGKAGNDAAYKAAWNSCISTFSGWGIAAQETRHSMCLLKMKTVEGLQNYQSAIRSHGRDAMTAQGALRVYLEAMQSAKSFAIKNGLLQTSQSFDSEVSNTRSDTSEKVKSMDDQSADGYDTKVKRASNTSENGETGKDSGSSSRAGKHRKKRKIEGPLRQATLDQNFFKAVPAPNPPSSDSDISYVGRKLSAKARGKLPARN